MDLITSNGPIKPLKDLEATIDSKPEDVAKNICENLNESNEELMNVDQIVKGKIVATLGKDKTIHFYNEAKHIEENGGMLTANGSRRKTPGGVLFYLINQDDTIPRQTLKDIFSDISIKERQKRNQAAKERRKKKNEELKERLIKEGLLTTLRDKKAVKSSLSLRTCS